MRIVNANNNAHPTKENGDRNLWQMFWLFTMLRQ